MEAVSLAPQRLHQPWLRRGRGTPDARVGPPADRRQLALAFGLGFGLLAALLVAWPGAVHAAPTEQEVKAALLLNVTRFVEWPAAAFDSPTAPLVIAILGADDVSEVLHPMLAHKNVNGHPLEVRHVRTVDEARKCHVLYVAGSEKRRADAILKVLRGTTTLTIADIELFAERGGHVNLVFEDQRVRILVNPMSATESHLKISAKLLSLAQLVGAIP